MKEKYVGKILGGKDIRIASISPNRHMVITGISGSGKSVRMTEIEMHIIEDGGTVVAFDINGTHGDVPEDICNVISVLEDGLDVNFLDTSLVEQGRETKSNLIDYVMETICPRELRGARQLASVRKGINLAIENRSSFACDMDAIKYGLSEQEEQAALGAYNHLCNILEGNIFRRSKKKIEKNKINVISLRGLNPKTQKRVVEIMLNVLWRKMRMEGRGKERFTLVIDEFQNIDFRPGTALFQMLTEVRQYGVELLLATQTLAIFDRKQLAVINQAATKLFFRQSEADASRVAEMIEFKRKGKWMSESIRFKVGQAVAVGTLECGGRIIEQPIITYSTYVNQENGLRKIRR